MQLEFSGSYALVGDDEVPFSFITEVDDEAGRRYLAERNSDDGYSYYGMVKDMVIDHLVEEKVLPNGFQADVHEFSNALSEAGLASLNFKMSAEGYDSISFPCLSNR